MTHMRIIGAHRLQRYVRGTAISIANKTEQMTTLPRIASTTPFAVEVEAGKDYYWCTCGLSAREPFCDGRHEGTPFKPIKFTATEDETVYFCGCKQTATGPFCDGTHTSL